MCSKRLMGDECFNNFWRQTHFIIINTFLCYFRPYGPPYEYRIAWKLLLYYKLNTIVFNNVHLQHQKASVILWTKTCQFHKAFLCCFMSYGDSIGTVWISWKLLVNKSEIKKCSIMSIYNTIKFVFSLLVPWAMSSNSSVCVKIKCDGAFIQSINWTCYFQFMIMKFVQVLLNQFFHIECKF